MKEHPRFTCRREGHLPATRVVGGPAPAEYLTTCSRCGETLVQQYEPDSELDFWRRYLDVLEDAMRAFSGG